MRRLSTLLIVSLMPIFLFAQDNAKKKIQWYEIVGGILAIPTTIIGIFYSIALIKKTQLETQKIKVELKEKENALREDISKNQLDPQNLLQPIIQSSTLQLVIYRFILLYILLTIWSLVEALYNYITGGIMLTLQNLNQGMSSRPWFYMTYVALNILPDLGRWLIIIGLGIPLYRDINKILNIDVKNIVLPWRKKNSP